MSNFEALEFEINKKPNGLRLETKLVGKAGNALFASPDFDYVAELVGVISSELKVSKVEQNAYEKNVENITEIVDEIFEEAQDKKAKVIVKKKLLAIIDTWLIDNSKGG